MDIEKPQRVTLNYTQQLIAPAAKVFPLLCPVKEAQWLDGWAPYIVLTDSGVAERDCVFITPSAKHNAIWIMSEHDPKAFRVQFYKVTPEHTVGKITIVLTPGPRGCMADITYSYTAIGDEGVAFIAAFTPQYYQEFMKRWELTLNHYLRTGTKLIAKPESAKA